jgi:ferrous iron transport protein B
MKKKTIIVGLAGNPNSGKTSIFNALTGARQKVANWSGVTVEKREGKLKYKEYTFKIVDLPGTYSLSSYSIEEIVARDFIISENPDVIINVVDAGNLDRNLYLTTQLIDMRTKVVMALNMHDEAESKGIKINTGILGALLGMDVVVTIATKSEGIEKLLDAVIDVSSKQSPVSRHIHINYGNDIESEIKKIQNTIRSIELIKEKYSTRWLALRLLEGDRDAETKIKSYHDFENILKEAADSRRVIEKKYNDDIETIFTDMRYGFITGAVKESVKKIAPKRRDFTEKIDKIVTNRFLAFPILILFILMLFELTFTLGQYPMNLIDKGVRLLSALFNSLLPDGALKDLLVNGILGGIGGVIIFLPNILILFMGISFMEDTGYMARAAFIMDKIMHKMGLHGKSFISLVMGFGCNVPAIMATRSLENTKDRVLTILINPFMSCSARLPVYILFAGTFFSAYAGAVITSLYMVGIILAFLSAKLFNAIFFKGKSMPFVMELPPYRLPTLKTTLLHMWDRGSLYLKKVAGTILIFSIIIWVLSAYPKSSEIENKYSDIINNINNTFIIKKNKIINSYGIVSKELIELNDRHEAELEKRHIEKRSEEMKYTFIGRFGKAIYPAIKPLGFNWQMGISLTTGFVAKEIVVSTMSVLYHSTEEEKDGRYQKPLREVLKKSEYGITPLIAYTFLLFVLMYVPCIGTVSVIGREAGWRWAFFSIAYQITLAWIVCFVFYNAGLLLGF